MVWLLQRIGGDYYDRAAHALMAFKDLPRFRGAHSSACRDGLAHRLPAMCSARGELRDIAEGAEIALEASSRCTGSLLRAFPGGCGGFTKIGQRDAWRVHVTHAQQFPREAGVGAIEVAISRAVSGRYEVD